MSYDLRGHAGGSRRRILFNSPICNKTICMTSSRFVMIALCLLVALPSDFDTLVSRSSSLPSFVSFDSDSLPTTLVLKKSSHRLPIVVDQEARCEFDEDLDIAGVPGNLAPIACVWVFDWPRPVTLLVDSEIPRVLHPISSWRLLGRYRC